MKHENTHKKYLPKKKKKKQPLTQSNKDAHTLNSQQCDTLLTKRDGVVVQLRLCEDIKCGAFQNIAAWFGCKTLSGSSSTVSLLSASFDILSVIPSPVVWESAQCCAITMKITGSSCIVIRPLLLSVIHENGQLQINVILPIWQEKLWFAWWVGRRANRRFEGSVCVMEH